MGKEELDSGQHYWKVMVWDKAMSAKPKSSWCVGVVQKSDRAKTLRALCYDEGTGFYPNTHDYSSVAMGFHPKKLGLLLNCETNSLSFYNADKTSDNHLHTFYNMAPGPYSVLLSPGARDKHPLRILN